MARCTRFVLALALGIAAIGFQSTLQAADYLLFYLGGQSNMDGHGYVDQLPDELNQPVPGVMIYDGNRAKDATPVDGRGVWAELQPGHGAGFSTDGKTNNYSNRVGSEVTLGRRLKELLPDANIAMIKYSRGGTSIAEEAASYFGCWEPDFAQGEGEGKGVNQYDHFLATVRKAMAIEDINGDGEPDRLIPAGIVWMQGESDAHHESSAAAYEANLKRLMDLIRAAFRKDDLPVVIGRISDSGINQEDGKVWDYGDQVRAAEAAFVEKDAYASLVTTTDNYGYSDPYHYDTPGYIDLGRQFAEHLVKLIAGSDEADDSQSADTAE